jgi:hypothetical protein
VESGNFKIDATLVALPTEKLLTPNNICLTIGVLQKKRAQRLFSPAQAKKNQQFFFADIYHFHSD